MPESKTFTIRGQSFILSQDDVIRALRGTRPGPIRKYYIKIGNSVYPIKQALAKVTRLPLVAFTSQDAFRIFQALGFAVEET